MVHPLWSIKYLSIFGMCCCFMRKVYQCVCFLVIIDGCAFRLFSLCTDWTFGLDNEWTGHNVCCAVLVFCPLSISGLVVDTGTGHHLQDPSLRPHICSPQVELWWPAGEDVELPQAGANVSDNPHQLEPSFMLPRPVLVVSHSSRLSDNPPQVEPHTMLSRLVIVVSDSSHLSDNPCSWSHPPCSQDWSLSDSSCLNDNPPQVEPSTVLPRLVLVSESSHLTLKVCISVPGKKVVLLWQNTHLQHLSFGQKKWVLRQGTGHTVLKFI